MRKTSWIVLGVCVVLVLCLGAAYILTRTTPDSLNKDRAALIITQMQNAVKHRDVNTIMSYVSSDPETRIAGLEPDRMRRLLASALHRMESPRADVTGLAMTGGGDTDEATLSFDLTVHNDGPGQVVVDYTGHVTLELKRVDVPHLFGLYHTREWRIIGGTQNGPDITSWGDD